jgi:hypothetical protein
MKITNISPQTRQNQPKAKAQPSFGMLKITRLQQTSPIKNPEKYQDALMNGLDKVLKYQKGSILYPAKTGDDLYLSTKYAHMTYHEEKLKDAFNRLIGNDRDLKNQIKFSVATEKEAKENPVPIASAFEPPKIIASESGAKEPSSPVLGSVERILNYRAY